MLNLYVTELLAESLLVSLCFVLYVTERLAESLRVPHQAPSIMAQVFLCVRVLILRMSSHQLTSLWPTVITEMVSTMSVCPSLSIYSLHRNGQYSVLSISLSIYCTCLSEMFSFISILCLFYPTNVLLTFL